jgi:tetratricopeptide (TPR) repeat protein
VKKIFSVLFLLLFFLFCSSASVRAGGAEDAQAAWAAFEQGNNDLAIELATRAINSGQLPSKVLGPCYLTRGFALANKGEYDEAISNYTSALEYDSEFFDLIYFSRGNAWYEKGQYDKAISDYNKTTELNPKYTSAYYNRGNAWYEKGQYDKAISDYNKTIALDPKYASAFFSRGNAWYDEGQYDKAIADYSKVIELNPQHARAYYRRGSARGSIGDNIRAIEDFTKNIELNPNNGGAYSLRGYLRGILGQYKLAEEDHLKAIELSSQSSWENYLPWVLQHYADLWRRQGSFDEALDSCKKAIAAGEYSTVYFRRAWIYLDMGKRELACQDFKKFQEIIEREGKSYSNFWPDEREALKRLEKISTD